MTVLELTRAMIAALALGVPGSPALTGDSGAPACSVEVTRVVAFSGRDAADTIRIAVTGKSCLVASFMVEIRNREGALLYTYETPLSEFYPSGDPIDRQSPDALAEQARRLVTSNLPSSPLPTTTELPSYQEGHFELDEISSGEVLVDQATYSRLRGAALPLLHHSTAIEAGQYVVYDPDAKRVVAVLASWL